MLVNIQAIIGKYECILETYVFNSSGHILISKRNNTRTILAIPGLSYRHESHLGVQELKTLSNI